MTHHVDHATITLAKGGHDGEDSCGGSPQRCLFEWYSWLTRDEHTDACPPGVSRVLHSFGIALNDLLPDDRRQELVRYLPNGTSPLAGTDDGRDEARGYLGPPPGPPPGTPPGPPPGTPPGTPPGIFSRLLSRNCKPQRSPCTTG